jgi:hypothetical protein
MPNVNHLQPNSHQRCETCLRTTEPPLHRPRTQNSRPSCGSCGWRCKTAYFWRNMRFDHRCPGTRFLVIFGLLRSSVT